MQRHVVIARDSWIAWDGAVRLLPAGRPVHRQHCDSLSIDELFNQLTTPDLFEPERCFVYLDFLQLPGTRAEAARIEQALARQAEGITLVCTQVFEGLSKAEEDKKLRSPDFQRIAGAAELHDLRSLSETAAAARLLRKLAGERGLELTESDCRRLYELSGEQYSLAAGNLEKLDLYCSESAADARSSMEAVLSTTSLARFYSLADAVMARSAQWRDVFSHWWEVEAEAFRLHSELRRRFLGLRLLALGRTVNPPYFAQQLRTIQRHWPYERMDRAIELLADTEFALKSGKVIAENSKQAERDAVELLLAQLQSLP
jgi:DNA polymerase III delta subunit